jgi:translation elongation factor EF-Tu-like GTPase
MDVALYSRPARRRKKEKSAFDHVGVLRLPQKRKKIKIKKGQSMMMMMSPHVIKRASVPSVYKRKKEEDGRSRGYLSFGRPQYICTVVLLYGPQN